MAEQPTLSVVLPVYNAEQTLVARVTQLLDVLPDLTSHFEVLVINDGSTDQTEEIAYDLARVYPQIRVTRHTRRRGQQAAIETGLAETTSEILLVPDDQASIDPSKLQRLWDLRDESSLALAGQPTGANRDSKSQLAAWGIRLEESTADGGTRSVQLIRRQKRKQPAVRSMAISPHPSRQTRSDGPQRPLEFAPPPWQETHQRHRRLPHRS